MVSRTYTRSRSKHLHSILPCCPMSHCHSQNFQSLAAAVVVAQIPCSQRALSSQVNPSKRCVDAYGGIVIKELTIGPKRAWLSQIKQVSQHVPRDIGRIMLYPTVHIGACLCIIVSHVTLLPTCQVHSCVAMQLETSSLIQNLHVYM